MVSMLALLFASLLGFGLVRQSITFPYEDWHPLLLRNIFLHPYYMLYGEVYADQIDTCGDNSESLPKEDLQSGMTTSTRVSPSVNSTTPTVCCLLQQLAASCVPGAFISPLYMTGFMLVANVLLMNMMIASCNWIFENRLMFTEEIWLFNRYSLVMEYEQLPFLPPPFTFCIVFRKRKFQCTTSSWPSS